MHLSVGMYHVTCIQGVGRPAYELRATLRELLAKESDTTTAAGGETCRE